MNFFRIIINIEFRFILYRIKIINTYSQQTNIGEEVLKLWSPVYFTHFNRLWAPLKILKHNGKLGVLKNDHTSAFK